MTETVAITLENLKKNRFGVTYVETKADVLPLIKTWLQPGEVVAVGGSMSLVETAVLPYLQSGEYAYLDRYAPGLTDEERQEVFIRSMSADTYFCSSNAVTMKGELYNVDGNANRIAAIAYGPKRVIMVVGVNKIVPDLQAAIRRVKTVAAPLNTKRLDCNTYCQATGHCMKADGDMTDGCGSDGRICSGYLVSGWQRHKERIQVILVGEPCGY